MRIAINTRFLLSHKMEGFGWYTYEIVRRIVENHPEHDFIFFFDRPYDEKFVFGGNVTPVVLGPQARHPFLFYIWFEFSVKKALKKYNADIFFSPDGYLSLSSKVKQIITIHDINFEHNPKDVGWLVRKYLCHFFPKFAKKADHILTVSDYSKNDISKAYAIPSEKITSIWNSASDIFRPLEASEREETLDLFANGKPYFLFVGALSPRKNIQRLIQAFQLFKVQNPSNETQLLIVGEELWNKATANLKIEEHVKKQIHFTGYVNLKDLALLMGAAKVFTYVPYFEGFGIPLVEAMKCGTPILAGNKTSLPEVANDAALYCDPFDVEDIAAKLTLLESDDAQQQMLSQKGLERAKLFSWDESAKAIWEVICSFEK